MIACKTKNNHYLCIENKRLSVFRDLRVYRRLPFIVFSYTDFHT